MKELLCSQTNSPEVLLPRSRGNPPPASFNIRYTKQVKDSDGKK
jgi:hypothetical protein